MDTTAPRSALGRRLVRGTAAVVATVALGLGLSAGTAAAEPSGGGTGGADCDALHGHIGGRPLLDPRRRSARGRGARRDGQ
jgi:hypothetical protein